jgi:hypothetical protein
MEPHATRNEMPGTLMAAVGLLSSSLSQEGQTAINDNEHTADALPCMCRSQDQPLRL